MSCGLAVRVPLPSAASLDVDLAACRETDAGRLPAPRARFLPSAGQRRGEDAKGVASAEVWRAGSPSYSLNRGAGARGRLTRGRR